MNGSGLTKAGKSVDTINVHCATTADTFSARPAEGQSGVHLVLDLDQCVQHHWSSLVHVDAVLLHARLLLWVVWVPSVDLNSLHLRILCDLLLLDML